MRMKTSVRREGSIGFFAEDENGRLDEFLSVKTIERATEIVNQLQADLLEITNSISSTKGEGK